MKAEASARAASVSQALTEGACPICGLLKDFQWNAPRGSKSHGALPGARSLPRATQTRSACRRGLLGRVAEFLVGQRGL
jgi:hypothetical protein